VITTATTPTTLTITVLITVMTELRGMTRTNNIIFWTENTFSTHFNSQYDLHVIYRFCNRTMKRIIFKKILISLKIFNTTDKSYIRSE
jgi:hypothetical protein